MQYLADIEEHLGVTIDQVDTGLQVTANEFDGKVTYGQKRSNTGALTLRLRSITALGSVTVGGILVSGGPT